MLERLNYSATDCQFGAVVLGLLLRGNSVSPAPSRSSPPEDDKNHEGSDRCFDGPVTIRPGLRTYPLTDVCDLRGRGRRAGSTFE